VAVAPEAVDAAEIVAAEVVTVAAVIAEEEDR
jgi:hypothetical protein